LADGLSQYMDPRFVFPLGVMLAGLTVGYVIKLRIGECIPQSKKLTRVGLVWLDPLNVCLALWGQEIADARLAGLPLTGLSIALLAVVPAYVWVKWRKPPPKRAGVLVTTSLFSNLGPTFGTFLCFVLAGEAGFAAAALFALYFYPTFFTLGFIIARRYGSEGEDLSALRYMVDTMKDPASRNPVLSVFVGLALSFWAPERPAFLDPVPEFSVPITTFVYLVAIGMTLDFSKVAEYTRHAAGVGLIKFVYSPMVGLGFVWLWGRFGPEDVLYQQVVFIQSCMPAAIFSLILANLFNLNRNMANTIWLLTNGFAIILSPLILVAARALG
jgi:hypothetical protein